MSAEQLREMLDDFAAANQIDISRLLIAKAVLTFPFEYYGDYRQFDYYAPTIFACKRIKTSKGLTRYEPLDEIEDDTVESGDIDRANLDYTVNITEYLQKLIGRNPGSISEADDLWIMPTMSVYDTYNSTTYYYADYLYYTQSLLNGTADARHPELILVYAILK